jgi:hypothetical protein
MPEARKPDRSTLRESLPNDLKAVFDELVTDYKFLSTKHHGRAFVSYAILADLIRMGWRLSARPTEIKSTRTTRDKGKHDV